MTLLTGSDDPCVFVVQPSSIAVRHSPGLEIVLDNFDATPLCGRAILERFDCLLSREPYTVIFSYTVVGTYLLYSCWIKPFERPFFVVVAA